MRKIALVAALAGAWAGCAKNFDKPVAAPPPLTAAQKNFDAVWDASLAVLRDYRFTVAVQNRREGTIASSPLAGRYFTEFWRKDAVTPQDVVESTLQNLYKTATVSIRPVPDRPDEYTASVAVEVARSEKPSPVITSTSEAYGLFTMTGRHSRWLTEFGRGKEEDEEDVKRSGAVALRPLEETPTTGATGKVPAASMRAPLGRDPALEREMTAQIAAAVRTAARTAPAATATTNPTTQVSP
jgi:hypothetical protein